MTKRLFAGVILLLIVTLSVGCTKTEISFSHSNHPLSYFFSTLTMKAFVSGIIVLASPMLGVSRLLESP